MYKILLIDDFFVEREKAKKIISQSGLELEVSGEASNGYEALELIESKKNIQR